MWVSGCEKNSYNKNKCVPLSDLSFVLNQHGMHFSCSSFTKKGCSSQLHLQRENNHKGSVSLSTRRGWICVNNNFLYASIHASLIILSHKRETRMEAENSLQCAFLLCLQLFILFFSRGYKNLYDLQLIIFSFVEQTLYFIIFLRWCFVCISSVSSLLLVLLSLYIHHVHDDN